jgi:hypothetical protein
MGGGIGIRMGMDTVELVMAIEEEFGIDIPNQEAETLTTVGEMYDYLRLILGTKSPAHCMSQRLFYKVRRALIENYGVPRQSITVDSMLKDIVPESELKQSWPYLEVFSQLTFPRLDPGWWPIASRLRFDQVTLRELIATMLVLNAEKLLIEPDTDEGIWVRMCKVIVTEFNFNADEIRPGASFTKDLGLD